MIAAEAAPGVPVRLLLPDGHSLDAHGVIKQVEGRGAFVLWSPPAQLGETWVPDIAWLVRDEA